MREILKRIAKAAERGLKMLLLGALSLLFKRRGWSAPFGPYGKILVAVPENSLGDMISKVALIETLKASFPSAIIDVLVLRNSNRMVLQGNPSVNGIIYCETDNWHKLVFSFRLLLLALGLRKEKYDLAVTPSNDNLRCAVFCRLAGAKRSAGFTHNGAKNNYADIFLTDTFEESGLHFVEKNKKLGAFVSGRYAVEKPPVMPLLKDETEYAESFWKNKRVENGDLLLAVHPFYGPFIEKGYTAEQFKEACKLIKGKIPGVKIAVFWGPTEIQAMDKIRELAKGNILIDDVDFRRLAALLKRPDLFICCNTGTSHLASIADIPVLLLCEKSLVRQFDPWGSKNAVLRTDTYYCSNIKPAAVAEKAVEMLRKYSAKKLG